jgi:VWFA-related protein
MKALSIFFIISIVILSNGLAQSGRKIKGTPTEPVSKPSVEVTQNPANSDQADSQGYSESSPNAPITLSPGSKKKKKDKKTKPTESSTTPPDSGDTDDEDVIKIETNLVTIPVSVNDRNGFYVTNLQRSDFKIFEDGVEQEIAYFGTSDAPFTVVLLIDVSPSTSFKIEEIQDAANAFVRQLNPQDQVMVIEFDSSVHVLTEITGDREKISKAIRKTGFGDGTSLYEAVDFSLRKKLDKIEGRKAVVLFTDGVDTTSRRASYESTLRIAQESEAVVFPIYYNTFLDNIGISTGGGVMSTPPTLGLPGSIGGRQSTVEVSALYTRGRTYLNQLAATTGGKLFRAESTLGGLTRAFESIAEELRRQYNIGYYPINEGSEGERKQIKVRVNRPKLIIRSRDSYIVGS